MTNGEMILKYLPNFLENALLIANESEFAKFANSGKILIPLNWWNTPCSFDTRKPSIVSALETNQYDSIEISDIFSAILTYQNSVLGGKIWTTDDIVVAADEAEIGFVDTSSNIADVANLIDTDILNDCTDEEWDAITDAIKEYVGEEGVSNE